MPILPPREKGIGRVLTGDGEEILKKYKGP
jgi:hypothetical protein